MTASVFVTIDPICVSGIERNDGPGNYAQPGVDVHSPGTGNNEPLTGRFRTRLYGRAPRFAVDSNYL